MSIPIPAGMEQAPVTWTLGHTTGTEALRGARGLVRFEPTAVAVAYPDVTVLPATVTARVSAGVMDSVDLTVNDPELWNWRVVPELGVAWTPFHIDVPVEGVDLADVVVVPGRGPIRAVTGPPGRGLAIQGELPDIGSLPDGADIGDGYLIAGALHVWNGATWTNAGPIRGPQGIPGPTNHLTLGEVTTGPALAVSITGEAPSQKLNFTFGTDTVEGLTTRLAALEYKSGPRDITSRMSVQPVSGRLYAERIGDVVWCDMSGIRMPSSAGFVQLVDLFPAGFRPRRIQDFATAKRNNTDPAGSFRVDFSGTAYFYVVDSTRDIRGVVSWPTRDAPPSTLPGTPA